MKIKTLNFNIELSSLLMNANKGLCDPIFTFVGVEDALDDQVMISLFGRTKSYPKREDGILRATIFIPSDGNLDNLVEELREVDVHSIIEDTFAPCIWWTEDDDDVMDAVVRELEGRDLKAQIEAIVRAIQKRPYTMIY